MIIRFWLFILALLWTALYWAVRNRKIHASFLTPHASLLAEFIAATGLLALATVGFFWQVLLTNNAWMPAGGGDLAPFLYPNYRFAAEHLRQGIIPLWNPHLYSGTPFAADIQTGLFYPINWLVFLLVPNLTFEWLEYLAIFHFWLAGSTMYVCLRLLLGRDWGSVVRGQGADTLIPNPQSPPPNPRLPAFVGALAFEFSDLFIVHFGNLNMIAVAAWLPLVFILFHYSLVRSSLGLAAVSGAVLAIATLAGHIQITLFILLTLALYAGWWICAGVQSGTLCKSKHTALDSIKFPLQALFVCFIIMIGLSALLLLPAYEMSRYTPRAELAYTEASRYSLNPVQLIGLLIPNYFGRDPALHWGPWDRVETGYIGILPLMLALVGLFLHPSRLKYYFVGLATIALLLAMGGYTVFQGWLYALVPGFNQLRAPARFILLLDFSLVTLAAMGLQILLSPLNQPAQATLTKLLKHLTWSLGALIVVAVPLAYYATLVTQDRDPSIFRRATGAASGVVIFAILTTASLILLHFAKTVGQASCLSKDDRQDACPTTRRKNSYFIGLAAILLIGFDLFTLGHNVDVGHTDPTAKFNHPAALAFLKNDPNFYHLEVTTDVWHLWQPDTALLHRLDDVWGLYNPLTLADTTLYWSGAPPRNSERYNFLGIKYIIASKAGAPADGKIVPVFDADPDINIYLNLAAHSRVSFVNQATIVANHDAAWQAIRAPDFAPTKTVILESSTAPKLANSQPASSTLALQQYDNDIVTVAITNDSPGYLVLADAYYPGWQATIDGQTTPIYQANYAFRAVYVPTGAHTIRLVFAPLTWKIGLTISGLTLLGLFIWTMTTKFKTQQ